MVYTGCNKGGVTVRVVRGYETATLLPWSSRRSLDFHSFQSAVRHFCFAYDHRFSPSHSLPCLALSVLWAVITSHYIFSFVVFDQSNELYPAAEIGSVSSSFSQRDDSRLQLCIEFIKSKRKKNTIQHQVVEKMEVGGCLSTSSPTLLHPVCLRQWGWNSGASRMHLTLLCCPLRPLSSSSHLAESRTMLDLWMCTWLLGNNTSWYRTILTEWDRPVDLQLPMQ